MIEPARIRLSRAKGFNLQAASFALNGLPAVIVARPTKWGNPFRVGQHGTGAACVQLYLRLITGRINVDTSRPQSQLMKPKEAYRTSIETLRGKNLACWCKPGASCHGDVLLALANGFECKEVPFQ